MFIDTHSHIHFRKEFPDIEAIFQRAGEAKVTRQIIVGCTPRDSEQALEFVKKYADFKLWSTLGVHPHNANECNDEILRRFSHLAKTEEKIVALGEIGLDYFRNFQPREIQIEAFKAQLRLAKELDLPAVVHIRDAWEDAIKILLESGNTRVILHCFTGDTATAEACWSRGYHTSFSGVLTYPKNDYLREAARLAPPGLLLIETDCPYLTPQPFRGKRNEPAYVTETAKVMADVRGVTLEEMAKITTRNALNLFRIS